MVKCWLVNVELGKGKWRIVNARGERVGVLGVLSLVGFGGRFRAGMAGSTG